jgi:hypothetical protein
VVESTCLRSDHLDRDRPFRDRSDDRSYDRESSAPLLSFRLTLATGGERQKAAIDGTRNERTPRIAREFITSAGIHFNGGTKTGSQRSSGGLARRVRQRFRNNSAGGSSENREKQISARKKSRARQACNPSA